MSLAFKVQAQNNIKGSVTDTINHVPLRDVSVSVLTAADSFLYKFTRTDKDGAFQINVPADGKYFLLFEYPNYVNYTSDVQSPGKDISLGHIVMLTKAHLLEEVVVKKRVAAITIKGDTTEFAADSFKVQPNATVDELLRKLPGLQVDKDGNITAQGKKVQKVLVDGEEFFGDDPKLVTKNLRADIIDKVQVFDKKSDQAAFTGISDGNDVKTINLKIKENAKHGSFGKLEAGAGTKGFHQSQGNFNQFNKSEKFSITGAVGNTSKVGLDWENNSQNWNMNDDNSSNDAADIQTAQSSNSDLISWDGNYGNSGIPLSQFGGIHYDNMFKYGTKLLGDYKINNLSIHGNTTTDIQNNLPEGAQITHSDNHFDNKSFRNKLDGRGEIYLDSTKSNSMIVNMHGQLDHRNSASRTTSTTMDENGNLVNDNHRNLTSTGDINTFTADALFRHKFKKERRTLSIYVNEQYNKNNNGGFLDNVSNFYSNDSSSVVDQRKDNRSNTQIFTAKATYSEPLSKNASLIMNYGIVSSNSNSDNLSFNKDANNQYNAVDLEFSNKYKFNQFMHRTGVFYYYNTKKTNFNIGTNVGFNQYKQTNEYTDKEDSRHFVNWYPQAFYRHNYASNLSLNIRYNGNNTQPSMTQIQPLAQNTDPLNIYLGNQDLKPSYSNGFSMFVNKFDLVTFSGFYGGFFASNQLNAITTNTTTELKTGKTTYQYINANGNYNVSVFAGYFTKLKNLNNLQVRPNLNFAQNRVVNFINNAKNNSISRTSSIGLNLNMDKEKKYYLSFDGTVTYNQNKTSIQSNLNNNYFSYNLNPSGNVYLAKTLKLDVDYNFNYYGKSQSFSSAYTIGIFNASLTKTFFENEGLAIRAGVNDLFNKNVNLQRTNSGNQIYQVLNTTIRRYFLFSVIWNFKTGMATAAKN